MVISLNSDGLHFAVIYKLQPAIFFNHLNSDGLHFAVIYKLQPAIFFSYWYKGLVFSLTTGRLKSPSSESPHDGSIPRSFLLELLANQSAAFNQYSASHKHGRWPSGHFYCNPETTNQMRLYKPLTRTNKTFSLVAWHID